MLPRNGPIDNAIKSGVSERKANLNSKVRIFIIRRHKHQEIKCSHQFSGDRVQSDSFLPHGEVFHYNPLVLLYAV